MSGKEGIDRIIATHEMFSSCGIQKADRVSPQQILRDYDNLESELTTFSEYMNSGPLELLIASHPRIPNKNLPPLNYKLHPLIGSSMFFSKRHVSPHYGSIWFDGEIGMILTYHHPEHARGFVMGGVSFNDKKDNDVPDVLAIVQLQGYRPKSSYRRKVTRQVLKSFQWEKVLVNTVELFCHQTGIDSVGILSAEKNLYYRHPPDNYRDVRNQRLVRRYNATAENTGYLLDESGLYLKDLS